jgi:hypothetical protein
MTYSSGSIIVASDYNGFVSSVNTQWSTGATVNGYGQTAVATVAAADTVTATQWSTLLSRISSMASHQGTSITSITSPVAGNTISTFAALSTNITAIQNGKANAAASGTDITTNGTTSTTTAWANTATATQTFTFPSADQARYFWNAGGMIRLSWSRTGGTVSTRNTSLSDLLTASGTIVITQGNSVTQSIAGTSYTGTTKVGGSGSPNILTTTTGWYSLTPGAAATNVYKQFEATAPYTASYINVSLALNAASTVLTVVTSIVDSGGWTDSNDGTLSQVAVIRPPSTTYLTNTWGTPAMSAATWSLT